MSVYRQMGCVYRCFLQLNFHLIILLFSGSPTIKDCNHLKMDPYFSHLHHWGPLIIGDVLFSVEHRKEPQFNLGQVFYSHFVQ